MNGDRDKCGLSSLLPMSCRGRAESFARRLHSRLRSLGSQDCDSSADENSWLAAHEGPNAVSLQPRHSSDSDLYFHFGLLESPDSPVDEIPDPEFSKLITNPADNLHPPNAHGIECHCPKKKDAALSLPKGSSQDSDSSDGVYYDPEITESTGLEPSCANPHLNGVCSPDGHEAVPNHREEQAEQARENGQSDGIVSPVSSESTAAPPSLTLSEEESTLSLHDDEPIEYTSLEYSHTPDIPLTELQDDHLYLYQGLTCCSSSSDEFLAQERNVAIPVTSPDDTCQNRQDAAACSALQAVANGGIEEQATSSRDQESCRDIAEAQYDSTKIDNILQETNDTHCRDLENGTDQTQQELYWNKLEVDKEMVIECPAPISTETADLEIAYAEDAEEATDSWCTSTCSAASSDSESSEKELPTGRATAALDIVNSSTSVEDEDEDEETREACKFLQSLGSPKKEFKDVCQLLQDAEDEDDKEERAEEKCEGCEEERIPRVRRCSSLKTGKTPPGTPGRKKIVRFADVLGLDLADVRTFMDEIPKVPAAAYSDLAVSDLCSDPVLCSSAPSADGFRASAGPKPEKVLVPLFQQPSAQADFLDRVKEKLLCLENAMVSDPLTFSICGTVRVRNLDFHKSVHIRYSLDGWKSFADLQATYCPNSCDGFSDTFEFLLYCHTLTVGQRIEFAVRFQCKGFQYWDNNCGANYCFQCLPASSGSQYVPLTGMEEHWHNSAVFY